MYSFPGHVEWLFVVGGTREGERGSMAERVLGYHLVVRDVLGRHVHGPDADLKGLDEATP